MESHVGGCKDSYNYVSMPHGPVLRATLDLINEAPEEGESDWGYLIARAADPYCVTLRVNDPPTDELSEAEEEIVNNVYERYGHLNRYRLRDMLHEVLPEWKNPQGSSWPIEYRDILTAGKKSAQEIAEIESEIEGVAVLDAVA